MTKKIAIFFIIALMIIGSNFVYALDGDEVLNSTQASEIIEMKESSKARLQNYIEKYGSAPYGVVAMILNIIRIYSIPCCFAGIAMGSIYQYVIGIRRLDVRDKGFALIIGFVTLLVICQILPLVFAVIVNFWRG